MPAFLALIEVPEELPDWATYGSFLALAAGAALLFAALGAVRLGVSVWRAAVGYALALAAGLAGARLLDVALNRPFYEADPSRITALEPVGFALYGGLAAGGLVALTAARWWGVSGWRVADSTVPAVVAGIVLLRVGCFLAGCCAGAESDLPWAVRYPAGSATWAGQVLTGRTGILGLAGAVEPVHPTQLYELGAVVILGVVAWAVGRRGAAPGVPALTFAAGFTLFRLANQAIRAPLPGSALPDWVLPVLSLSALVAVAALFALRARSVLTEKIGAAPEGAAPLLSR